jgi:hypothetical protein
MLLGNVVGQSLCTTVRLEVVGAISQAKIHTGCWKGPDTAIVKDLGSRTSTRRV